MLKKSLALLRHCNSKPVSLASMMNRPFSVSEVVPQQSTSEHGLSQLHKKRHTERIMDPKFYEDEYVTTSEYDLEYVRSPFYDLAKSYTVSAEEAEKLLEEIAVKQSYLANVEYIVGSPAPTKESVAYTRYADTWQERENEPGEIRDKYIFEFPRGKPY